MVYKKYIKKDGKLYGPYIYQSKRVDGKVVSEYCGPGKKENKNLIFYLITFLALGALILIFFLIKGNLTGNVTLNLANQNVDGISENALQEISLSLKKGEFIPDSSNIIFDTSQGSYEFPLNELLEEETQNGEYFVEGESLTGQGTGYGLTGEKIIYPELEFTLISRTTLNVVDEKTGEQESGETLPENIEQIPETQIEILTEQEQSEENENLIQEEQGIVLDIIENVNNFFLGLSLTANVVESSSDIKEIDARVSKDNPFSYELKENEIVELVSGSVTANGKNVEDNFLNIYTENGKFIVESEYSEIQQGYGQEFLTEENKILTFQVPEQIVSIGNYEVRLVYPQNEQELNVEIITPEEINEENLIISENETLLNNSQATALNATQVILNSSKLELTLEEKQILVAEFGNFSVNTFKSQLFNGRYIIGYNIGKYEIEYSYDSSLNQELLNSQIEADRIKWLKDLAYNLKDKSNSPIEITQFENDFSIF